VSAARAMLWDAVADELIGMRDMIEAVATALATDAALASRHLETLQSLDLVAQTGLACAALLRAGDDDGARRDALQAIGLADLKQRLSHRILES